jgi:hypothetical protein
MDEFVISKILAIKIITILILEIYYTNGMTITDCYSCALLNNGNQYQCSGGG